MFKNLFFDNRIHVQFIDFRTGELIHKSAMKQEDLPESFELNTTFTLDTQDWIVVEADPIHARDFTLSKKLKIKLQKVETINPKDIRYTLPTISNELPGISESSKFDSFCTTLYEDDWRQREFLNRDSFPLVEIEVKGIIEIWENHNHKVDGALNTFDKIHVRNTIGLPNLNIDIIKLQEFLTVNEVGSTSIVRQGFIEDGFSIKTENTTYYGTVVNNVVKELCILSFNENTIKEIEAINHIFNLIHVDWYNYEIIADND